MFKNRRLFPLLLFHLTLVTVLSMASIGSYWIYDKYQTFSEESERLKRVFVEERKRLIKDQVEQAAASIAFDQTRIEARRRDRIKARVEEAWTMAQALRQAVRDEPEANVQAMIVNALGNAPAQGGVLFVLDAEGRGIVPAPSEARSKARTVISAQALAAVHAEGEGYAEFSGGGPGGGESGVLTYAKRFAPYGWTIGLAEPLADAIRDAQRETLERLARIRFGRDGYLFGSVQNGDPLFTNGEVTMGGPNILGLTDPFGVKIIQIQNEAAQEPGGGFVEYSWRKLNAAKPSPKIAYVMAIPRWNWIIGAGFYADDVDKEIAAKGAAMRAQVMEGLARMGALFVCSFAGVFILALFLSRSLDLQFSTFSAFFGRASRERVLIDQDDLALHEFKELARAANHMLSERDAVDNALRKRTEEFDRFFSLSLDLSCIMDMDGRIRRASPSWETVLGRSPGELEGRSILEFLHPDDVEAEQQRLAQLAAGENVSGAVNRLRRKDGAYRCVEWRAAFLEGRVYGAGRDMTERLRLERELVQAKERAEDANRSKSEFLANMSHEIRTPLNGVMGMLQILKTMSLGDKERGYVDIALDSGKNLLALLSDILDLSRIEAGKMELREHPFSPASLFASVMDLYKDACAKKGLALSLNMDPLIPDVLLGDEARLRQALFNLTGNAVKFTHAGGVRIEASRIRSHLPDRVRLFVTVSDDGEGIDEAMVPRVFERFTQASGAFNRKYQGAGLGLPIVKRILELMGGNICVDSEPGKGTAISFDVCLRPASRGEAVPEAAPAGTKRSLRGLRVLAAEDDRVNRMAVTAILRLLGCEVLEAGSGQEALDMLEKNDPDLILMDVQMPGMDGLEATRIIRHSGRFGSKSRIPVIALTAHAMEGDKERFLTQGMDGYLSKPVEIDSLRHVLERIRGVPPRGAQPVENGSFS